MVEGKVVRVGRRTLAVAPKPVGSMRPEGRREMLAPGITERHGRGVPLRVERQSTPRDATTLPMRDESGMLAEAASALAEKAPAWTL